MSITYSFVSLPEISNSMDCPKCRSSHHVKDGIVWKKQRFRCKACGYRYTVARKSDVKPPVTKRLALELYLEGLSFRAIGRILKISYETAHLWMKEREAHAPLPRSGKPADAVAPDKMLEYIESKKNAPHRLLLIDLDGGNSLLSDIYR